eukprot:CAMPEP_0115005132 /NCGR_PEP_ID=MMETSP0216-20121206/19671_1 /TAXON_ID=223996 /ORGANISM="Protocruzia adherens, Strain Boccale" /LENGTH=321 /DNA_ID=CAMNT_0002371363 /DNA_START=341 /DNA_END=1306 /DNA_ORIENTATION=-
MISKKLNLEEYELLQTVGTGSFGRVRIARHKVSGKYVAMKILKKAEILRSKQVDHIISENTILSCLNHPFLVKMDGFCQDDKYIYFALEYISGGELFTYLRQKERFPVTQARFYGAQVVSMFRYLHNKNIIYRDLKPENLLIDGDGYLKLTDFGFSKMIDKRTYTLCGTPEYLAPEILLNKGHGRPVDWWCLGILVYEMIAGIDPFSDEDPMAIYQKILRGRIRFPRFFDKDAKSLVKHLLVADPSKRYGSVANGQGADDIINHRWFKELDWDHLESKKGIEAPYKPEVRGPEDTSNFSYYPDSDTMAAVVKPKDDPFLGW